MKYVYYDAAPAEKGAIITDTFPYGIFIDQPEFPTETLQEKPENLIVSDEAEQLADYHNSDIYICKTNGHSPETIFRTGHLVAGFDQWVSAPFEFRGEECIAFILGA